MGDRRKQALRVQFDGKHKLKFHGEKITSGAGSLAFRELDEAFRLTESWRPVRRHYSDTFGQIRWRMSCEMFSDIAVSI